MSLREACNTSAHGEGVERLRQPDLQITFKTLSPYSSYYAQQAPSAEPTGYWPTSPHWNWRIWPVRPQGGYVTLTSRFTLHSLTFYSTEICLPSNKNFDSKTKRKTNAYDKNFEQLLINNGYLAHWSSGVIPKARILEVTERDPGQGLGGMNRAGLWRLRWEIWRSPRQNEDHHWPFPIDTRRRTYTTRAGCSFYEPRASHPSNWELKISPLWWSICNQVKFF